MASVIDLLSPPFHGKFDELICSEISHRVRHADIPKQSRHQPEAWYEEQGYSHLILPGFWVDHELRQLDRVGQSVYRRKSTTMVLIRCPDHALEPDYSLEYFFDRWSSFLKEMTDEFRRADRIAWPIVGHWPDEDIDRNDQLGRLRALEEWEHLMASAK